MAGVYIHIPYCVKKCAYCDFVSAADDGTMDAYTDALVREIALTAAAGFTVGPVDTLYLGGGTPSLLSGAQTARILSAVRAHYPLSENAECSMECNPGTGSYEAFAAYRDAGIDRLSIGLQSANDALLTRIGRIHSYAQFCDTLESARRAGFTNINADVMHGLPGQTQADYLDTLQKVCDAGVQHVSAYALILNEDTPLYDDVRRGRETVPDDDAVADMQDAGMALLEKNGYARYEISNFAKPGFACRHNLNYWRNGEYLGFGAAAHSAVRRDEWTRYANVDDRRAYMRLLDRGKRPVQEILRLFPADEMFETVMLGLRLVDGVDRAAFRARFGADMAEAYPSAMEQLRIRGWVTETDANIALNRKGLDMQNRALQFFM